MLRHFVMPVTVATLLTACESQPMDTQVEPAFAVVDNPSAFNSELASVRAATARFHDVNVAIAAGYQPVSECVSVAGVGAMGIHYLNMGLVMDAGFTPAQPEVLLYMPQNDGSLKLLGVEYIVLKDAWHGAGNAGAPQFQGNVFEAGPGAPPTYALHAWVWAPNPAGTFAPFNARLSCPTEGTATHSH